MKSASVAGVQECSSKFLRRCVSSPGGVADIFVSHQVNKQQSCPETSQANDISIDAFVFPTPSLRKIANQLAYIALHAYACDCVTHHLFHPHGTDCITNKDDEEMMHQVAADDSLQSKSTPHTYRKQNSY